MKLALILAALTLSTVAHAKDAPPGDITPGFFDLQKAMADSDEGKKNVADEKADLEKKQAQLKPLQDASAKAKADCDAYSKRYDDVAHGGRVMERGPCDDADKKSQEVGALGQRLQAELQQRQQANGQRLIDRVNRVLPAIARAKHLAAVVPLLGTFYLSPSLDQTAEVVRRLNAGEGSTDPLADATARADRAEERARAAEAEVERIRKLGLKAVGLAKTAVQERDKATAIATDAVDLSRRALGSDEVTKPAPPTVPPAPPIQPKPATKK